jgi:hypothetical protein
MLQLQVRISSGAGQDIFSYRSGYLQVQVRISSVTGQDIFSYRSG